MIRIAIVEDEKAEAEKLKEYLNNYGEQNNERFDISLFGNSSSFIMEYKLNYDIIFLDIELPDGNGMDTAKAIRRIDGGVTIIFVTNMAQYAVNGYSVSALDFMVKPVNYFSFSTMLSRALVRCKAEKQTEWLIHTTGGAVKTGLKNIIYIEVSDHKLIYHTDDGEFEEWGKLSELEKALNGKGFARGNNCYLINLRRVVAIADSTVILSDCTLQLSRPRKNDFVRLFAEFISGSGEEV